MAQENCFIPGDVREMPCRGKRWGGRERREIWGGGGRGSAPGRGADRREPPPPSEAGPASAPAGVSGKAGPSGQGAGRRWPVLDAVGIPGWGALPANPRPGVQRCQETWTHALKEAWPAGGVRQWPGGPRGPGCGREQQRAAGSSHQAPQEEGGAPHTGVGSREVCSSGRWHTGVTAGAGGGGWLGCLAAKTGAESHVSPRWAPGWARPVPAVRLPGIQAGHLPSLWAHRLLVLWAASSNNALSPGLRKFQRKPWNGGRASVS